MSKSTSPTNPVDNTGNFYDADSQSSNNHNIFMNAQGMTNYTDILDLKPFQEYMVTKGRIPVHSWLNSMKIQMYWNGKGEVQIAHGLVKTGKVCYLVEKLVKWVGGDGKELNLVNRLFEFDRSKSDYSNLSVPVGTTGNVTSSFLWATESPTVRA